MILFQLLLQLTTTPLLKNHPTPAAALHPLPKNSLNVTNISVRVTTPSVFKLNSMR